MGEPFSPGCETRHRRAVLLAEILGVKTASCRAMLETPPPASRPRREPAQLVRLGAGLTREGSRELQAREAWVKLLLNTHTGRQHMWKSPRGTQGWQILGRRAAR